MTRALYDVVAPAKLNLFLHVVGKRPDGYHLIQSLFVLIDWCDTLHFELRSDGRLVRHDLAQALPADDLCLRAARLLQRESGTAFGVDLSIEKRLPSGAGMGGGSSDAASTLLALNRLWRLNWPRERLHALGLQLGADVPFFIGGRNALVEGIGERLTPVDVPPQWLAVLKPAAGIDTRAIFASPRMKTSPAAAILESFVDRSIWHNDLQAAAEAKCPDVTRALDMLKGEFGNSRMTGSGSAVFAEAGFADAPSMSMSISMAALAQVGWAARMCRSLVEHPLGGWAD